MSKLIDRKYKEIKEKYNLLEDLLSFEKSWGDVTMNKEATLFVAKID